MLEDRRVSCFSGILAFLFLFRCTPTKASHGPLQLQQESFSSFIDGLPSSHGVLMEYYANWCPTCQHFQPEYEKIAEYFNTEPKVKPEVVVARVDCATQNQLCNRFGIARYPTLKYGLPAAFQDGSQQKLEEFAGMRNPTEIIHWVGQQRGVEYNYDSTSEPQDVRRSTSRHVVATESGVPLTVAGEAKVHDIEKATMLAFKYALEGTELLKGSESRQAFKDFVDFVAVAHPVDRCREGTAKMQEQLPQLWPADQEDGPDAALRDIRICGEDVEGKEWNACQGSKENKRGYTCGLWMLFHSLAGRSEPQDSGGAAWLAAIKGYVKHFFQCTDCATHFTMMASETAATAVRSRKQAVLWAWRAHNEVNRRLESVEKTSGDGDPAFPKMQWPPSELCPLCRLPSLSKKADVTWNEEEVYRFLLKYYHGFPEPGWVTQKLGAGSQLLGLGGRKNLAGAEAGAASSHHVAPLLIGVILLGALGFVVRQRMRRSRKQISS